MHEYPATRNILDIAERKAREAGADRVEEIRLVVGELCGLFGECIRMYFDILAEGTVCEGARLSIRNIEPKLRCDACGGLFTRVPFSFDCTLCGEGQGQPTDIGREFYIEAILVPGKEEA